MRDEARYTSSHRAGAFNYSRNLRHMPVEFVSAGLLAGTLPEREKPSPPSPVAADAFAQMRISSPSPAPSEASLSSRASSEEQIVFRGRQQQAPAGPQDNAPPTPSFSNRANTSPSQKQGSCRTELYSSGTESDSLPTKQDPFRIDPIVDWQLTSDIASVVVEPSIPVADDSDVESDTNSVVMTQFDKRRGGRPIWEGTVTPWTSRSKPGIGWLPVEDRPDMKAFAKGEVDPRQAAMDDYMQNVEDFGLTGDMVASTGFARREMDLDAGSHNDWESDARNGAIQSSGSDSELEFYADSDDDGQEKDEDEIEDEIQDAIKDALADLDDESLARAYQKQADLGFDSDNLVLYDGDELFSGSVPKRGPSSSVTDRPSKRRLQRAGGGRSAEPTFPSASAMADALDMDPYGAFDIMDTERPSLRRKKRGRRGQMPPELDDPDLNEQLQTAWETDRSKKRLKKAEREELRKQGLLGRKGKAPDLSVKYKDGADVDEVIEEIRTFMASNTQTLSLPPMEAHRRAIIHQLVHHLGVSSKSRGSGAGRFTVLSKTQRVTIFNEDYFDELISHKFRTRLYGRGAQGKPFKKDSGARARAVVSYKDGDVVGASAPEIGPGNIGHMLLSKMGWTKGMALGAEDNKGILNPIAHVVKTTKAGLK